MQLFNIGQLLKIIIFCTIFKLLYCFFLDEEGQCYSDNYRVKNVHNFFPFVLLQPFSKNYDENQPDLSETNIWCEGVMISEVWGIAPPNCFLSHFSVYLITLFNIDDNTPHSYPVTLTYFWHQALEYIPKYNINCNYIGLFKLNIKRFVFNFLLRLPQRHISKDLMDDTLNYQDFRSLLDCRIVGVAAPLKDTFLNKSVELIVHSVDILPVDVYCHLNEEKKLCSMNICKYLVNDRNYFNITYARISLPRSSIETGCQLDSNYKHGSSLICKDIHHNWIYVGLATNEVEIRCGHIIQNINSYQAFTRIDAYINWINSIIDKNGGLNPTK